MRALEKQITRLVLVLFINAGLSMADDANMPPPGTLNYLEGQVSVQGQRESVNAVGTLTLDANQVLNTGQGNAELLLTPGVFLRVGHNSEIKMLSPGLADTGVQLLRGSAMVEVDEIFKENNLTVAVDGSQTRIEKVGLYAFSTEHPSVKVLDGKAEIRQGTQKLKLTKGHEALLAEGMPMLRKRFDKNQEEAGSLFRWSKLRSDYETQANVDEANNLVDLGGWWGPGWYWDPLWWDFAFLPGAGIGWGPFGYPFFSPWAIGYAPYYGFGYGYGYGYGYGSQPRGIAGHGRSLPPLAHEPNAGLHGFRPLSQGIAGGRMGQGHGSFYGRAPARSWGGHSSRGFSGAAGGFHGGGFGGGFHGGGGFGGGRR